MLHSNLDFSHWDSWSRQYHVENRILSQKQPANLFMGYEWQLWDKYIVALFFFQLLWAHHYRGPKWVQVSMNKRYLLLPGLTFIIPRLTTGLFFADWQYCPQVFHSLFKKNHKKNIQWVNAWVTRFKPGHHGECNPECSHRGQKKICPLTRFNSQKGKLRTEILAFQYFVV